MVKGDWKPRSEYQTLVDPMSHRIILTRHKDGSKYLCIWVPDRTESGNLSETGGHFHVCPMVPIFYGTHKLGCLYNDYFDEWMEVPE